MRKRFGYSGLALTVAMAVVTLTVACGDRGQSGSTADARVVAGFYPLAEAAARVGGDRVEVTNLTPSSAEPHDLELNTRDVDRIEDADLVIYVGSGFQPAVEEAAKRAGGRRLDVLAGVDDDANDPHIWLDPVKMASIAEQVRDALVDADAEHAEEYRSNATTYLEDLKTLDDDFSAGLDQCQRTVIVTAHDAFGHLARRYDLEQESIAGIEPDAEPDPKRLAELVRAVKERGVTTIFAETIVSPKLAETLAREAGVTTAVLDPIEGLSEERIREGDDYSSVMRENLVALKDALGCP